MWLYLILNIASFIVPFLYSFEKRMYYASRWRAVLGAITITAIFFIIWDIIFTKLGVWWFNPRYHSGLHIYNLPLEECLFFFCIPYASIFLHFVIRHFFPKLQLSKAVVSIITFFALAILALVALTHLDRLYTSVNFSICFAVLIATYFLKPYILQLFYITYLAILVPFAIVNGILTGSFIDEPVVYYNNAENLGIRLGTIPVEDTAYAFGMILMSLLWIEFIENKKQKA